MSSGQQLQEMEVGTKQSKTAVNANAKPAQPMEKLPGATWEDLGGPTPDNYKPDNDSAKLKDPGGPLKKVSDAVTNRKGKTLKQGDEVEVTDEQEVVAEEPATEVEETIVADPSAPDAFVEGIMEGKDWVWDGSILREKYATKTYKTINTLVDQKKLDEQKLSLFNDFLSNL